MLLKVLLLVLQVLQLCVEELKKGKSHEGLVEGLLSVMLQILNWDSKEPVSYIVHVCMYLIPYCFVQYILGYLNGSIPLVWRLFG